jgi:NADH-quinone oxidoreductase subunit N
MVTLFSMAGVPPLAGFFTKLFILSNLVNHSFYLTVLIILIFSVISNYYYLNFIKYVLFEKNNVINLFFFDLHYLNFGAIILFFSSLILILFIALYFFFSEFILKLSLCSFFMFSELIL